MNQIFFADKVSLNQLPSIAQINKVTSSDMNEIKQAINSYEPPLLTRNIGLGNTFNDQIINSPITVINFSGDIQNPQPPLTRTLNLLIQNQSSDFVSLIYIIVPSSNITNKLGTLNDNNIYINGVINSTIPVGVTLYLYQSNSIKKL